MATNIYGTNAADTIYQNSYRNVNIYGYDGNDRIYLNLGGTYGGFNYVSAGNGDDRVNNVFEGGNRIYLGEGNDYYYATGFSTASNYYDRVWGGNGNDTFEVSTFHSDYYGEGGNDTFFSVGFNNLFDGGSGNDTISFETQDDDPDLAGYGIKVDLYEGYATANGTDEEILVSIENAAGTGYNDTLLGSDVANKLWGSSGNDVIKGYAGNDFLYGEGGSDGLSGGAGNDFLNGGAGRDDLMGGSGADTFYFASTSDTRPGSQADTIQDFRRAEGDKINLSAIDAETNAAGNQAFHFIGSKAFTGDHGELRFSGGVLSGDTNGDGVADFQIKINGMTSMQNGDFIL